MQATIPVLLKQGHQVIGVDNFFRYGEIERQRPYTFLRGDLSEESFVKSIFVQHKIDYVIQAAARIFGVRGFHQYPADILLCDTRLHANVLRAAHEHGVKRVTYISSSMVYERTETAPTKEDDVDQMRIPLTDYGLSKLVGERLSKAFWTQYGLPYTIWRPFNIITPFERAEKEPGVAHVFADFLEKILVQRQNPMEILGDGNQIRSFTWIYEVADAIGRFSFDPRTENTIFNLGQYDANDKSEAVTMKELAQKIFDKGKQHGIIPADEQLQFTHRIDDLIKNTDVKFRIPDPSRARHIFGWTTVIHLDEALDHCVQQMIQDGLIKVSSS